MIRIFIITIMLLSVPVHAAIKQEFIGWGLGQAECKIFVLHADNDSSGKNKLIYLQWFNGYITGINYERESANDVSEAMDRDLLYSKVLRYCRDHDQKYVWQGVNQALKEHTNGKHF